MLRRWVQMVVFDKLSRLDLASWKGMTVPLQLNMLRAHSGSMARSCLLLHFETDIHAGRHL
jgi:hypothetical protein